MKRNKQSANVISVKSLYHHFTDFDVKWFYVENSIKSCVKYYQKEVTKSYRHGSLMVSHYTQLQIKGLKPCWDIALGKALYSHNASLHPGIQMGYQWELSLNLGIRVELMAYRIHTN